MSDTSVNVVRTTEELLHALELQDIFFVAINAERAATENPELADGAVVRHQVMDRRSDTELQVRVESTVEAVDATYVVDLVTRYVSDQPYAVDDPEVVRDFIERVALLAAWPYVRQQVAELAATFRTEHVTLPLLRPGDIALERADEQDEAGSLDDITT